MKIILVKILVAAFFLTVAGGVFNQVNSGSPVGNFWGGNGNNGNSGGQENGNQNNNNNNNNGNKKDRLDLKIDSTQHYNGNECVLVGNNYQWTGTADYPAPGTTCTGTWTETDLNCRHKFFKFDDVKPGDFGEDTISLHLSGEDGCGQILFKNVRDEGNGCNDPETKSTDPDCNTKTPGVKEKNGELREALLFSLWLDQGRTPGFQGKTDPGEGDNIFNEQDLLIFEGKNIQKCPATQEIRKHLRQARKVAFDECQRVDRDGDGRSTSNICQGLPRDGRMLKDVVYYYGFAWLLPSSVGNEAQTDSLEFDVEFRIKSNSQCSVCQNQCYECDARCGD